MEDQWSDYAYVLGWPGYIEPTICPEIAAEFEEDLPPSRWRVYIYEARVYIYIYILLLFEEDSLGLVAYIAESGMRERVCYIEREF